MREERGSSEERSRTAGGDSVTQWKVVAGANRCIEVRTGVNKWLVSASRIAIAGDGSIPRDRRVTEVQGCRGRGRP